MNALRIAALCVVTLSGSGCALLNAAKNGDPMAAAREADKIRQLGADSQKHAETKCAPLKDGEVGFNEERAIGGVVGVELISKNGHLYLEGITEKNPETLNKNLEDKKPVTLPDGAINDLTAYVSVVGKNLARYSARPDLPWTFAVIKNDSVNAFSAPGGYVVVTTALLKKITNEAQLAGVLGHEIGHVVLKHSLKKYQDAKHKQCIAANYAAYLVSHGGPKSAATDVVAGYAQKFDGQLDLDKEKDVGFIKFIMEMVTNLLQLGNDKQAELDTDKTSLELISFAGYDAAEYEKFLATLDEGGTLVPAHPSLKDRIAALKGLREGELAPFAVGTAKPDTAKMFAPMTAAK